MRWPVGCDRSVQGVDLHPGLEHGARARSSAFRAGSPGVGPEVGHAEVDGGVLGGQLSHGGELLPGCGEAGLDRGHFAEPALLLGLAETVEEVDVDLLQSGHLGGVGPKLGATNAGVFMLARGPIVTGADAESDLAELEMTEEPLPLLGCDVPVLFARPQGSAAGDEGPV